MHVRIVEQRKNWSTTKIVYFTILIQLLTLEELDTYHLTFFFYFTILVILVSLNDVAADLYSERGY